MFIAPGETRMKARSIVSQLQPRLSRDAHALPNSPLLMKLQRSVVDVFYGLTPGPVIPA